MKIMLDKPIFYSIRSAGFSKIVENILIVGVALFFCSFFLSSDRGLVKQIATLFIAVPVVFLAFFRFRLILPILKQRALLVVSMFFFWALCAYLINSGIDDGLKKLKHFALNIAYILAVILIFEKRKTIHPVILTIVGLSASISVVVILFNVIAKTGVGYIVNIDTDAIRLSGLGALYWPISSAYIYAVLLMYLCIALAEGAFNAGRYRYINIFNIVMVFVFVVGSGTRAALFSIFLITIIFLSSHRKSFSSMFWFMPLFLFGLLASQWLGFDRGFSYRPELWSQGLKYAGVDLFFGQGDARLPYTMQDGSVYWHPHNEYINLVIIAGLPALFLFLACTAMVLNYRMIKMAIQGDWALKAAMAAVVFTLFTMLVSADKMFGKFDELYVYFWFPLAFIFSKLYQPETVTT